MSEFEAECLLLGYPGRWNVAQEVREQIIEAYGNGDAYREGWGCNGGHGDDAFKKVARLVTLTAEESYIEVVREWLTVGLDPKDRSFLICLWRGRTLMEMDRDAGQIGSTWRRLQGMVKSLSRFAGHASGEPGLACAATRTKPRPEL